MSTPNINKNYEATTKILDYLKNEEVWNKDDLITELIVSTEGKPLSELSEETVQKYRIFFENTMNSFKTLIRSFQFDSEG